MDKKLYRDEHHKMIGGVCAGLAGYFNVDVAIVRLVFLLTLIFHGGGGLVYIILWIVLPKRNYFFNDPTVDYKVPPTNAEGQPGYQYTSNPFSNNPSQGNPFSDNPFKGSQFNGPPFPNQPYFNQPRKTSTVGLIFGLVLIIIGGSILLDQFDIIPDWDLGRLWPVILVVIGIALIFTGKNKQPWEKADWHKEANKDTNAAADAPAAETPPTDNPPIV